MQLYCLTYKHGNTNQKVIVPAETPQDAQTIASELLEERGLGDWKFTNTVEPIRAFIVPGTADVTIVRFKEAATA